MSAYAEAGQRLTPRELQILNLLKEGHNQPVVAVMLSISHQTIKNHCTAILTKMDTPNMVNAVYKLTKAGVL